jgi:hypothetical protein
VPRQFRLKTIYYLRDFISHAAQIPGLHIRKDVKNRLHVVMIHDDRRLTPLDRREISEQLRLRQIRRDDRCVLQILQRVHLILRRLHRDLVIHAVLKIEPVVGSGLATRAERNQHRLRNVALRQADLFGLCPIHVHAQVRTVDELVHVHIDRARNLRDARFDLVGDVVPLRVASGYLNIDRCRNAKI